MSAVKESDVLVIGAGLAGLHCAQVLHNHGKSVTLIDKNTFVGGRLRSFEVNGFILDQGFQLINPSYPALLRAGVLDNFDLRTFDASINFVGESSSFRLVDPRSSLGSAITGLKASGLSFRDLTALAKVMGKARILSARSILAKPDTSSRSGLLAAGLSEMAVDRVLQPFLRGTFLDDRLDTSWNYAQLVLKSFVKGNPGTHPKGIGELAQAFVHVMPNVEIMLDTTVTEVSKNRVQTSEGEIKANHVVLASDASAAHELIEVEEPTWLPQTTWWWSMPKLQNSSALRISLDDDLVTSALDLSSRAPERSPKGKSLVATPMNGLNPTPELEARAKKIVSSLYGISSTEIDLVETTVVHHALPRTNSPLRVRSGLDIDGVICAGDYLETPSIQGALASGAKAAQRILNASVK